MQKQLFTLMAAILLSAFILPGCKEDPPPPPAKTKTELITSSPWIFMSASANGSDVSNAPQLACFKDNVITFTSSTTGNINEGTNICSPTTAGAFTWNFTTGETILVLSGPLFPGGSSTFNIVSLTETNLVISQNVNFPPTVLVTITLKH